MTESEAQRPIIDTSLIPFKSDCKDLAEFENYSKELTRRATDIIASEPVMTGYAKADLNSAIAYCNMTTMANRRLKRYFPMATTANPLMNRLLAEIKVIVAECLRLKYEKRRLREKYDPKSDIDSRTDMLVKSRIDEYRAQIRRLTNDL